MQYSLGFTEIYSTFPEFRCDNVAILNKRVSPQCFKEIMKNSGGQLTGIEPLIFENINDISGNIRYRTVET